jgi:5'-nucleotidase
MVTTGGWTGCSDDDSGGPVCGNGECEQGEDFDSCPQDCHCGNGVCEADETATSCPSDCGCGNGVINDGEVCDSTDLGGATCESEGYSGGTLACLSDCTGYDYTGCEEQNAQLTLLHTSDLHHHASGYGPFLDYTPLDTGDDDMVVGGLARLAAQIKAVRTLKQADQIPVLLFDSADYFMGTVYDMTIDNPLVLSFFQVMGYDAVTIGNHEWDWSPLGYAMLIGNAQSEGFTVPIVASNMVLDNSDNGDDVIENLVNGGTIVDKMVYALPNGVTVGVIGLLGPGADEMAPTAAPVTFDHSPMSIQAMVDDLRDNEETDLVVVLSHGGIHVNGTGDDAELASEVDGIDVILSGHYHEVVDTPHEVNGTLITIPGEYGEYLSQLDLTYNLSTAQIEDWDFENIYLDDTIVGDATVQAMVEQYEVAISGQLQAVLGVGVASPIIEVPFDLPTPNPMENNFQETALGNMCADAMRVIGSAVVSQTGEATPFTLAVAPNGTIRDGLFQGSSGVAAFADVFNVMPLGMSPDFANQNAPGWPLISAYVTANEIKQIAEVSVTVAPAFNMSTVFLNISGIRVEYDPNGNVQPPDRVRHVYLCGGPFTDPFSQTCNTELDTDDTTTLYRIVTDLYTLLSLNMVSQADLTIVPKHADGTPIDLNDMTDILTTRLDVEPATTEIEEMKNWMALLRFFTDPNLALFPDNGGITGLPEITDNYEPGVGDADQRFMEVN